MADDHELLFTFIGLDAGIRLHPTGRIAITVFYSFQAGDILKRDIVTIQCLRVILRKACHASKRDKGQAEKIGDGTATAHARNGK